MLSGFMYGVVTLKNFVFMVVMYFLLSFLLLVPPPLFFLQSKAVQFISNLCILFI